MHATGRPGELVVPATDGVRFVQATREGLKAGPALRLAKRFECGSVVSRANGAGVIAGTPRDESCGRRERARAGRRKLGRAGDDHAGSGVAGGIRARGRLGPRRRDRDAGARRGSVPTRVRSGGCAWRAGAPAARSAPGELLGEVAEPSRAGPAGRSPATGEAFVLTTTAPDTGSPAHVPLRVWTRRRRSRVRGARPRSGRCDAITGRRSPPPPTAGCSWRGATARHCNVTEREPGGTFAAPVRLGAADDAPRVRDRCHRRTRGRGLGQLGAVRARRSADRLAAGAGRVRTAHADRPRRGARGPGDAFFTTQAFRDLYFGGGTLLVRRAPAQPGAHRRTGAPRSPGRGRRAHAGAGLRADRRRRGLARAAGRRAGLRGRRARARARRRDAGDRLDGTGGERPLPAASRRRRGAGTAAARAAARDVRRAAVGHAQRSGAAPAAGHLQPAVRGVRRAG